MTTDTDIDADEFEKELADIEAPTDAEPVELMSFTDLLDIREDLHGLNQHLTDTADYWAQITVGLETQVEAAEKQAESDEKAAAISTTAEKARDTAERIDGGVALRDLEAEIREAEEELE